MRHHAILISTSHAESLISYAYNLAFEYGNVVVTPIIESPFGVHSFAVLPDGSKEGWRESEVGDTARVRLLKWLKDQHYSDGTSPFEYCEVQYGDGDGDNRMTVCDRDVENSYRQTGL